MPSKSDFIRLPEQYDRRIKLNKADKAEIRGLYETGDFSLNQLARMYSVSKKTILLTVNDESMQKAKAYCKANWKQWQRTCEERTATQREHRAYKRKLYKEGKIRKDGN